MTPLSDAAFSAVPPEHWASGSLALGDGVAQALRYGRWPEEEPEPTPAMLRAAALGPLRVMLPMVAIPAEVAETRALMAEEAECLAAWERSHQVPPTT